jgi:transposase
MVSDVVEFVLPMSEKRDGRSLDHATLEEMRRLAIRRIEAGESQADVARSLDMHPASIWKWVAKFRKGGEEALGSTKSSGRPPTLSEKQQEQLKRTIVGKNPQQLSFGVALWTLPVIQSTIQKMFGVVLHKSTVARMLDRMGLTPQKPIKRSFRRDDEACERWAKEEFPAIVEAAKRKQATLLFSDEAGVHEDGPIGTTWAPKGERPVVRVTGGRKRVNVISAVSPRGRLWFRCYAGMLTAARFVDFLAALIKDVRGYIVLVVDRHPAHVAAATKRWLAEHANRIELHLLPPYAPDLNPDEHVWSHLKGMFRRDPLGRFDDLESTVTKSMNDISSDKSLVRGFFGHPAVAYVKEALSW